ncbi:hypothetical protein ACLB2K_045556 [Fragaria x ananassa]
MWGRGLRWSWARSGWREKGSKGRRRGRRSRRNGRGKRLVVGGDIRLGEQGRAINRLIDKGQLSRLVTSAFLHANVGHLLVNCYSLNNVGPTMEKLSGSKRFLAIYFTSAIASSAMSYWCSQAPAVGASGAVFGLVGSLAVFVMRHKALVGGGKEDLKHIAYVIVLNMGIGLFSKGIDNWGHLGGLLGGAATSWLLGPAWKYEFSSTDRRRIFTDKAPIFYLINRKPRS